MPEPDPSKASKLKEVLQREDDPKWHWATPGSMPRPCKSMRCVLLHFASLSLFPDAIFLIDFFDSTVVPEFQKREVNKYYTLQLKSLLSCGPGFLFPQNFEWIIS